MLNEKQKQVVVRKVNEDVDVPWVPEAMEARFIKKLVDQVAPAMEPSLLAIVPAVYVLCIKMALDEKVPLEERKAGIAKALRGELADPLSRELNARVDMAFIPEGLEGKVLKIVTNKIIDEFVESTVGKISEKLET